MMLFTVNKYAFFECSSAMQKAIRLGDEENALYFMVELFNSNYGEYVWKRLKIIVSEDVGLAEPNMPANIQALYDMYEDQKAKKHPKMPERLFLTHAVLMLCRCKKSRLIDWTVIELWRDHDGKREIPDYALDMHNQRGKKMGRGLDHFYNEGTKLKNHVLQDGEINAKTRAYAIHKQVPAPNCLPVPKGKPAAQKDMFNTDDENDNIQ